MVFKAIVVFDNIEVTFEYFIVQICKYIDVCLRGYPFITLD